MPSYRQSLQDRFENPPDHAPTRVGVDGGSGPLHTLSVVRVFRRVEHFGQARLRSVIEFILCAAFRRRPWIAGFQPFCLSIKWFLSRHIGRCGVVQAPAVIDEGPGLPFQMAGRGAQAERDSSSSDAGARSRLVFAGGAPRTRSIPLF